MNSILLNNSNFETAFDRCIVKSATGTFVLDCDTREAPKYDVALLPAFESKDGYSYSVDQMVYNKTFFAKSELLKRGYLSSMLTVLLNEQDLANPIELQKQFGGTINGLYKHGGQA